MRLANLAQRAVLITPEDMAIDIERSSKGEFGPRIESVLDHWDDFTHWVSNSPDLEPPAPYDPAELGSPVPAPKQVFAIGMNYVDHAQEVGQPLPEVPSVFTKFQSCITGPFVNVAVPAQGSMDWEAELVVVIGRTAANVKKEDAWSYVAGLSVGQDFSERQTQTRGAPPQFSMGKSFAGFGPVGPTLVTLDEIENPDDLAVGCEVNGQSVQAGRTSNMVFSVGELIEYLSGITVLSPGDLIFTGTPAGVGAGMKPPRFLKPGDRVDSWVEGIGTISQKMI